MAAAIYSTTNVEGVDINAVFLLDVKGTPEYPAPPFVPGERADGTDGSSWVYATASVTLGAGAVVLLSAVPGSWSASLIGGSTVAAPTGRLIGVVGGSKGSLVVPAPSGTQTGAYFWVQRAGNIPNVSCIATATAAVQLYSVPTLAGAVTAVNGGTGTAYQINGLVISQATGSVAGPNTGIANNIVAGL